MFFEHLITVSPLGLMYGSAGAFLSPKNLVGRSGTKFPPDAATLSGLFFSTNLASNESIAPHPELKEQLFLAGPFWAKRESPEEFYVPMPRHRLIAEKDDDEWRLEENKRWEKSANKAGLEPSYSWQNINGWKRTTQQVRKNDEMKTPPWKYVSFLHPKLKQDERHVVEEDGLFLENAVQLDEDYCLVYLATYKLPEGWYRFGGEGHMVEVGHRALTEKSTINQLLSEKIQRSCALITPGVWGSANLSYRYPKHPDFPRAGLKLLTDKAVPYRYRMGGRLGRGRYAVPAGSVYVFKNPLDKTWWEFPPAWFPQQNDNKEGLLRKLGCGLCLPVKIEGVA